MNKISITDLQRKIGEVTTILVRGEQIILTKNGKVFALITPIDGVKPKIEEAKKLEPHYTNNSIEREEQSEWPKYFMGKPLSGKKGKCPVCADITPVEFANQHYMKKHGDI